MNWTRRDERWERATEFGVAFVVLGLVILLNLAALASSPPGVPADGRSSGAGDSASTAPTWGRAVPSELLVRPDSRRLGPSAGGGVTFVEFLDFECEASRAAFPAVELLRDEYAGRVDFVIRYFPVNAHRNALPAAAAAEAAAAQGQFDAMYRQMYRTPSLRTEQGASEVKTIRGLAGEIGLDLRRFDADVISPTVSARVLRDRDDGVRAGVQETPTMFINGRALDQPGGYSELKAAIDQTLTQP